MLKLIKKKTEQSNSHFIKTLKGVKKKKNSELKIVYTVTLNDNNNKQDKQDKRQNDKQHTYNKDGINKIEKKKKHFFFFSFFLIFYKLINGGYDG